MRLLIVGRAVGDAVTVGRAWLVLGSVLLMYLSKLRGCGRLPPSAGTVGCGVWIGVWV